MKRITHTVWSWVRVRVRQVAPRSAHIRAALGIFLIVSIAAVTWFFTPIPTFVARYAWEHYHAGTLALALDRSDADLALSIGSYYFGNQSAIGVMKERPYDLSFAKGAAEKAIAINSSIALAHYMRARIEFVQADFNAALRDLDTELSLYPENKRTLYMRGLTYAYRGLYGDLSLAEKDFKGFIAWSPREWAGYNDLAYVLAKEKKYTDAAVVLKEGIAKAEKGSKNPWLWDALGVMELNLNEPSLAISSLTKAQTFAASLTETDWERAYPGNNSSSSSAKSGIEAMKNGIARNLVTAYAALKK